ncbi:MULTISPECIES: SDR family NAD(P)-dependent oxidoreductase [Ramlibacter]|uniref:SDR family oxidoreductase n=1 Tax=Ramlibacter pinisoli TaxID=2682844 RepID=A0A6N8IQV2_9BURK|nr:MULTISPECIES: SDR family oxidoreductase [Ramlibacter]MBA2964323.1 SDR family oxidoreductase [Ramlibacter sp. CGMCC 1.13660]MVQ29289.1 SDR family oxidoreductase [Ramlibacter pinisoli]
MTAPSLAGRTALVTGSGRNIGRAIALALAAEGARVAVNVRASVAEGQAVVDEIQAAGGQGLLVRADVTQRAEVDAMLAAVLARFGRLDVLVNNASVRAEAPFHTLPYAQWRSAFDLTVDGAFHCTQAAFDALCRSPAGTIVNISGMTASTGAPGRAHVVAAKAALEGLTRALAHEFAPHGVTVNCVSPGLVDTVRSGAAPRHHAASATLLGRRGQPGEIAAAVTWLAGDGGRFVTGQVLHVNGGAFLGG